MATKINLDPKIQTEQRLLSALNEHSPKDFIQSQGLKIAFGEFVARGTVQELWCLIPQTERASLLDLYSAHTPLDLIDDRWVPTCSVQLSKPLALEPRSPEPTLEKQPSILSSTPPSDSSSEPPSEPPSKPVSSEPVSSEPHSSEPPSKPLPRDIPSDIKIQVNRLFKTINGFRTPLPKETYEKLWTYKEGIFGKPAKGIAEQALNLQQGRRRIKTGTSEYDCASRFSLLLLAHFVDHIASWPTTTKLTSGQNRLSNAFKIFAGMSNTPIYEVKDDYARTKRYCELIEAEGPRTLLEIGPDMSAMWEKKLIKQDVRDVLHYREIRRHEQRQCAGFSSKDFAKERQIQNQVAANVIIDGLQANGCTKTDFFSSNTPLMQIVTQYLAGQIDSVTPSKKRKRGGSIMLTIIQDHSGLPRGRGSEDAERHMSNDAQLTPPLDRRTTIRETTDGRIGELLLAAALCDSLSQEQGQYHGSQESTAVTGKNFGPGLQTSNSSQEAATINQQQNPENGTRQIKSTSLESVRFDLEVREVRAEIESYPTNGNQQGLNYFISGVSDPAVEGISREQLMQNVSTSFPAIAMPGPGDSTNCTFYPACSFSLLGSGSEYPKALNAGNNPNTLCTYYNTLDTLGTYDQTALSYNNTNDVRSFNLDYYFASYFKNLYQKDNTPYNWEEYSPLPPVDSQPYPDQSI
ncbi:hypothetical protein SBOR_3645 [Sclerotinia borealis F-4128]|uniref:Uncharacterized protein n=1 Tax=Sclerotinia borealis (strain F-4128) TaxID=1432307 RepID=W9CIY0_SCLBF|nr:hypothetical protein SBOR_3645 [Sclerotinia borealis F-4128]